MKKAGYQTMYAGKYLNQYGFPDAGGVEHVPDGWDSWFGLVGNSRYYEYQVSDNGKKIEFGNNYETDYFTDVIKRRGVSFIHNTTRNFPDSPVNLF